MEFSGYSCHIRSFYREQILSVFCYKLSGNPYFLNMVICQIVSKYNIGTESRCDCTTVCQANLFRL